MKDLLQSILENQKQGSTLTPEMWESMAKLQYQGTHDSPFIDSFILYGFKYLTRAGGVWGPEDLLTVFNETTEALIQCLRNDLDGWERDLELNFSV